MIFKEEIEMFDIARKAYPGVKRGCNTELDYLCSKHKDWRQVLPLLSPAIKKQVKRREISKATNRFEPPWKNFKTWLYNRCWEETVGVEESKEEQQAKQREEMNRRKKNIRDTYQEYLERKSTSALKDIKADGGHTAGLCGWLIDEILERRTRC